MEGTKGCIMLRTSVSFCENSGFAFVYFLESIRLVFQVVQERVQRALGGFVGRRDLSRGQDEGIELRRRESYLQLAFAHTGSVQEVPQVAREFPTREQLVALRGRHPQRDASVGGNFLALAKKHSAKW